jgi:hypothetical protein
MTRRYTSAKDDVVEISSTKVYNVSELLEQIVEFCDWEGLSAIGITSKTLRVVRDRVISKRIEFFLSLFFDEDRLDVFFLRLKTLRCAVFGGIVRCIMSAGNPAYFQAYPRELYIVAPFDGNSLFAGSWRRFFGGEDYDMSYELHGHRTASNTIKRVIHGRQVRDILLDTDNDVLTFFFAFQRETGRVVNIIESAKPSLLPAVLSFGDTSACNLLTADNLYSLYPKLISRNENIQILSSQTFRNDKILVPFNFGLRSFSSASDWRHIGRPCGIQCEAVWRDSRNLTGSAVIPIACPYPEGARGGERQDPMATISSNRVRWTIGNGACLNHLCQNHRRGTRS